MIVGLDAIAVHDGRTWPGRLPALFRALAAAAPGDSFVLLENFLWWRADPVVRPNVRRAALRLPRAWLAAAWRVLPLEAATGPIDVYHAFTVHLPRRHRCRLVVTVNDLACRRDPGWFPAGEAARIEAATVAAVRAADLVVSASAAVAQEIVSTFRLPPSRVALFAWGVGPPFVPPSPAAVAAVRRRLGLDRPYILSVGTLEPRKNLARLVEAYRLLRTRGRFDGDLVLAGAPGWGPPVPEAPGVRRLGRVDDADLPALYGGAEAFAYVSLYEGFGIPILEAMSCGAPVVTSAGGACEETAGGAALLVDPTSLEGIADGLDRVIGDAALCAHLRRRGLERAASATWEASARRLLTLYRGLKE